MTRPVFTSLVASFLVVMGATPVQAGPETTSLATQKARRFQQHHVEPDSSVAARIREATPLILANYEWRRSPKPVDHHLSSAERLIVEDALRALPPLHERVLKDHVAGIYFLDKMPLTAQTLPADQDKTYPLFDFIINATNLSLNISQWLTEKESTCFSSTGSVFSVSIDCGTNLNALVYILLHEATHVVDYCEHITPGEPPPRNPRLPIQRRVIRLPDGSAFLPGAGTNFWPNVSKPSRSVSTPLTDLEPGPPPAATAFTSNIWQNFALPLPEYRFDLRQRVAFYQHAQKIPVEEAVKVYSSFSRTPFVSLYASLNWMDDLAEYFTVYHVTEVLKQPYRITVLKAGVPVMSYQPMKSPLVRSRVQEMKRFYQP